MAGPILLHTRSRWPVRAFAVSLAGLVGTTMYQYGVGDMPARPVARLLSFCANADARRRVLR